MAGVTPVHLPIEADSTQHAHARQRANAHRLSTARTRGWISAQVVSPVHVHPVLSTRLRS